MEHNRTFQNVTSDFIIKNIQENDISKYFKTIKEAVYETISNFKGRDNIKFKLIITSQFTTPLAFDRIEAHFNPQFEILLTMNNFDDIYQNIEEEFLAWVDKFQDNGSGFVFEEIIKTNIRLSRTNFLRASSYFPHDLGRRTCILNIQNNDQKCFTWSILAKIYPPQQSNHTTRVSNYTPYEYQLNMNNIEYPVKITDISKFEKQNPQIAINVFALEKSDDPNTLYPLYRTNYNDRDYEIDLLYLEKDGNTHYCLIKDLGSLLGQNRHHAFICKNCLQIFSNQQALTNHQSICLNHNFCKVNLPKETTTLSFNKHHFKSRLPIAIYADFEATNLKIQTVQPSNEAPYNQNISKQEVNSFGIYIKSDYNNLIRSQYYDYIGTDAKEKFIETIVSIYNEISKKLFKYSKANKTVKLTLTQQQEFNNATNCYMCNVPFNEQVTKIREHNHFNGKYRGAACQSCNTQEGKASKEIPVFFHNGSKYDFHFIVTELMKYQDRYNKVEVLPKTSEEYISITYGSFYRKLIFKDSYRFLQQGLGDIAESLTLEDFKIMKDFYKDINLLKQKGVYPYEYIDSLEKLNETQLPPIEAFYSTLKQETITEEEYQHAQNVWNTFNCQTLLDYHKLYLQVDVLILADAFEKFREFFLKHHEIDPAYCYSAPGLTWQCGFKHTKIKLDLLTDYDMLLMFENGIRGGYSGVLGDRYVKANNKYLDGFNPNEKSNYLLYLDANNLYGWAMSQKLPTGNFKWEEPNYNWRNPPDERGCIIECDLKYPLNTKFKTQKFPLAPEKLKIRKEDLSDYQLNYLSVENKKIGNVSKLILNLKDKEKYVIHYELLKYYEKLGLKVKKIHRIISFKQEAWLEKYINFNTEQRTKATSEFEKDLWKLMNNAFYGKTMENIRGRVNVKMLNTHEEARKMFSKPTYKDHVVFNNDLIAVLNNIPSVKFDKPIYLGMCILDYSKLLMYQFYYERINKLWPRNQIIGFDTDSFFLNIETEDVYKDMKLIQNDLDTSNYPNEQEYLKK